MSRDEPSAEWPVIDLAWLRSRDAGLSALRRAARTAIVMPSMFAIGAKVIGNPTLATFAAFGSFAMLLLVDFGGTMRERLVAQVALVVTGAVFVSVGTLASNSAWLAAAAMAVVGFAVLFAGVVSSVLAGATTSLLLGFILPVTMPGPVSSIPDRAGGWLLAGAVSVVAVAVLWPAPVRDPLRGLAVDACRSAGARLRAEVAFTTSDGDHVALDAAVAASTDAVGRLRTSFFATPYRPTGLTTSARAVVRLVDEVVWLCTVLEQPAAEARLTGHAPTCAVKTAAAAVLERGADMLAAPGHEWTDEGHELLELRAALTAMEQAVTRALPVAAPAGSAPVAEFVTSLEPSFRAQEMSFAVSAIAANIELAVAAQRRTWWQQLLGRQPAGIGGPLASAQERAGAHVERHSVWLHNSVRGAIAVSLAVLVADLSGVQHSFWVVLGTLSVLRSSALNTGQNALRGLAGTVVGFVIGGALVVVIGTNTAVLWVLLPVVILFAGLAPAVISFAAGQAGFTLTLLILFNIIAPVGWQVGLVRIEDVAIGGLVSLVVGALFWPRGAASALGQALAEAYTESAGYLRRAVAFGMLRCDALASVEPRPTAENQRAAAAARRLDDAFRGFLAERGTKHLPLATVTMLITGVAGLRLASEAVLDLWAREDGSPAGDRTAARTELLSAGTLVADWYETLARALAGHGPVPDALAADAAADGRLIDAVRRDLTGVDGQGTATAVRMIWTGDHLDAARRLQLGLVDPARAVSVQQLRHQQLRARLGRPAAQVPIPAAAG